jgi:hypothetical protein
MKSPEKLSKTQLAAILGVTKGRISQMVALGMPVEPDGSVDSAAANRWIEGNIARQDPAVSDTYQQARLINMIFSGKLLRLEYQTRSGRMVEREQVRQRINEHLAVIRSSLDKFVADTSPAIAAETDRRKVHSLMRTEITRSLHRLSTILGGRADIGVPPEG